MGELGNKIREVRKSIDMGLREYAYGIGISAAFLSDTELG